VIGAQKALITLVECVWYIASIFYS